MGSFAAVGTIAFIIIGGLAGWIASKIKGTDEQMGIPANIIVGVIGGLIGGWFLKLIGVDVASAGKIFTFITCVVGAVVLLTIVQLVQSKMGKK